MPAPEPLRRWRWAFLRVAKRPLTWASWCSRVVGSGLAGPLPASCSEVAEERQRVVPAGLGRVDQGAATCRRSSPESRAFPLFLLYTRGAGLTDGGHEAVTGVRRSRSSGRWHVTDENGKAHQDDKTVGDYLVGRAPPVADPVAGRQGRCWSRVALDSDRQGRCPDGKSPIVDLVETLRYHARHARARADPYVTGLGGIFADEFKVFGSLDTTLLLIAGSWSSRSS